MKKYLIIILIIIITIICTILIKDIFFNHENNTITVYQLSEKENNISNRSTLQAQNLNVTLKGAYFDGINSEQLSNLALDEATIDSILKLSDNNKYNFLITFSTTEDDNITEPTFDYLVYDNSGNVIMTSIVYENKAGKNNQILKYFLEKEHNTKNLLEFSNYNLSNGTTKHFINSTDDSNLILASSSDNNIQNQFDLSKIHILISNLSYKTTTNNDRINLDDTIFEFIIENK